MPHIKKRRKGLVHAGSLQREDPCAERSLGEMYGTCLGALYENTA